MTSKVTVDAHAGWPIEVIKVYEEVGVLNTSPTPSQKIIVPPNTKQDFYIWDNMYLVITELDHPNTTETFTPTVDLPLPREWGVTEGLIS